MEVLKGFELLVSQGWCSVRNTVLYKSCFHGLASPVLHLSFRQSASARALGAAAWELRKLKNVELHDELQQK